jgi:F420H(2)-dependent quinone reductase
MALSGEYEPSPWKWVRDHAETIMKSGTTAAAEMKGKPLILLTTIGAHTGKVRKTPLMGRARRPVRSRGVGRRSAKEPCLVLQRQSAPARCKTVRPVASTRRARRAWTSVSRSPRDRICSGKRFNPGAIPVIDTARLAEFPQ